MMRAGLEAATAAKQGQEQCARMVSSIAREEQKQEGHATTIMIVIPEELALEIIRVHQIQTVGNLTAAWVFVCR